MIEFRNSNEYFDILFNGSIRINFYICYLYFKELAFRLKLASVTSTSGASPSILCLAADNQVDYDGWIHSIAHISQNTNTEKVILQLKSRYKYRISNCQVHVEIFSSPGFLNPWDEISKHG